MTSFTIGNEISRNIAEVRVLKSYITKQEKGPPWIIWYWGLIGYKFHGMELKDVDLLQATEFAIMIQYNLYR